VTAAVSPVLVHSSAGAGEGESQRGQGWQRERVRACKNRKGEGGTAEGGEDGDRERHARTHEGGEKGKIGEECHDRITAVRRER
jgi:hypothetical protein